MAKRLLVVYASRYGSTREVASAVAEVLGSMGAVVEARGVKDVRSLERFDAVVLGSAVKMGRLLPEALGFLKRFRGRLEVIPFACFLTGVTLKAGDEESRRLARRCLEPAFQVREPVSFAAFGGRLDHATLGPFWRVLAARDPSGVMTEGDFRDWDRIRAWAREVGTALLR